LGLFVVIVLRAVLLRHETELEVRVPQLFHRALGKRVLRGLLSIIV
jgi:hypothetical protein